MLKIFKDGVLKNIIALLLCITIVVSCMYNYAKDYILVFTVITIIIQSSIFTFYNYISGKSLILRFVSVLGSFFAICAMVFIAIKTGQNKNSVEFFIWFLSPQALVNFSLSYIIATFIIINFFIASTVYYFSAVRYRISWTFMITLIPFAFYRKESEQVPVFFALLLLVMYVALMIHCRQLNTKPNQKMFIDKGYKKSVVYFLGFASLVALIIPKPDININNDWINYWLESDAFTNYMLNRLGLMSETSTSIETYIDYEDVKMYDFLCDEEEINVKHQTFCSYDFDENIWSKDIIDAELSLSGETQITPDTNIDNSFKKDINPVLFFNAVVDVCSIDKEFALKYNLDWLTDKDKLNQNIYKKNLSMVESKVKYRPVYYFVPSFVYRIQNTNGAEKNNRDDSTIIVRNDSTFYNSVANVRKYDLNYYSQSILLNEKFQKFLSSLDFENYEGFLLELENLIYENDLFTEYSDVISAYMSDYKNARTYISRYQGDVPESISELVVDITKKSDTIIKSAYAIQDYFVLNDFRYDLKYDRPDDFNMEYFLFEGKTGICGEYATAMVVMARSIGIPARYAEGIHLGMRDPETGLTEVTDADLHAYPELFIPGYGWASFEPTKIQEVDDKSDYDYVMMIWMIVITILVIVFIVIFAKYIHPVIFTKYFKRKVLKSSPDRAVKLIVNRIQHISGAEKSMTVRELSTHIYEIYSVDMKKIADMFEISVYSGIDLSGCDVADIYNIYFDIKTRNDEILKNEKRRKVV